VLAAESCRFTPSDRPVFGLIINTGFSATRLRLRADEGPTAPAYGQPIPHEGSPHMRKRFLFALLALVGVSALFAASALAARSVGFTAKYSGKVTEKVSGQTVNAAVKGTGTGNLVGKSAISGAVVATTSDSPCAPFFGPGSITGPKGVLKLKVTPTSRGCAAGEDDRDNISVSGTATITGGTKKFKKAKGTLRFTGHYDRSSGAFNVKLTGSVKL
jgi:hypothetical protein